MNCNPGDLAVVIRSKCGRNLGKVVRVVRLHRSETHDLDGAEFDANRGPRWLLERPLTTTQGEVNDAPLYTFPDASLRPIRDPGDDAQDETLSRLPVPTKETA